MHHFARLFLNRQGRVAARTIGIVRVEGCRHPRLGGREGLCRGQWRIGGEGVQRRGRPPGHVPAGADEELGHHDQAEGVLLAGAGQQKDAARLGTRGRAGGEAGAELTHGLLEAAHAHGDVGEVAQVFFPQLAQVARGLANPKVAPHPAVLQLLQQTERRLTARRA